MADTHSIHSTKAIWLLLMFTTGAVVGSATLSRQGWPMWLSILSLLLLCYSTVALLSLHQYPPPETTFACPWVPTVPLLGIACNSYMMGSMASETWLLICVWLVLGLLFYFVYGIHHSELRHHHDEQDDDQMEAVGTTALLSDVKQVQQPNYLSTNS
jgi:APA family basic amino acid/polyamine antiporter